MIRRRLQIYATLSGRHAALLKSKISMAISQLIDQKDDSSSFRIMDTSRAAIDERRGDLSFIRITYIGNITTTTMYDIGKVKKGGTALYLVTSQSWK
jgi:hypothetical protein